MQIWTVANQKGGVGKTTTAVALAGLAAARGQRVLLVDLDPQGSMSSYFRYNPDNLEASTFTLFQQRNSLSADLVGQLIVPAGYPNLHLLPASGALATLERQAIGPDGLGLTIAQSLTHIEEDFDLTVIDCPPQLGVLMVNALAACQFLLIPVQTEFLALKGLERMLHTLSMLGRSRKRPLPYTIVPTMYDRRTQASVSTLHTLRHQHGEQVWAGKIPVDTKLRNASKAGVPPHVYSPDSHGIQAYMHLLKHCPLPSRRNERGIA